MTGFLKEYIRKFPPCFFQQNYLPHSASDILNSFYWKKWYDSKREIEINTKNIKAKRLFSFEFWCVILCAVPLCNLLFFFVKCKAWKTAYFVYLLDFCSNIAKHRHNWDPKFTRLSGNFLRTHTLNNSCICDVEIFSKGHKKDILIKFT